MICKKCKHESYSHLGGYGQCQVVLVEREGEWYEISLTPGITAWTQDIEYGDQCSCPVMISWIPSYRKPEEFGKPDPNQGLDKYL